MRKTKERLQSGVDFGTNPAIYGISKTLDELQTLFCMQATQQTAGLGGNLETTMKTHGKCP
ncbi:MAG: hypothetical protein LBF13_02385 [Campylobacteraceae bacterium]|nr:hypothetical protein [Campylobacteraceae bacterium]